MLMTDVVDEICKTPTSRCHQHHRRRIAFEKISQKLFDSYTHDLQWDNVTLGRVTGPLQAKINSEFPEARYHYKTHMIATHLPDHFLPRWVYKFYY